MTSSFLRTKRDVTSRITPTSDVWTYSKIADIHLIFECVENSINRSTSSTLLKYMPVGN